jgi:DNA-directed RNA polymerase subunit RPC12/RpoP
MVGKRVRCPDCKEVLVVPAAPDGKQPRRQPAAVEAYNLEAEGSEPKRLGPEHYFSYFCPRCSARLRALRKDAGQRTDCPDCGVNIRIPPAPELRTAPQQQPTGEAAGWDTMGPPPAMREPVGPDAIENRIRPARPPRWTYFSGVFSFPFRGDAITRWGMLSIGLAITGLVATAGWLVSGVAGGGMSMIAGVSLAFFGLAVLWLSIWTFSYAAHCMVAILEDTSAGADEILSWPESDWRDWMWRFLQMLYLASVAIAVGFGISQLAGLWLEQTGVIWAGGVFVIFPILLLSSVDAGSPFIPLSKRVRRSLFRCTGGWLTMYLLSGLMWAAAIGICYALWELQPFLLPIVGGPVLAAVLLVYARLLGRLAWQAAGRKSARKRKRS